MENEYILIAYKPETYIGSGCGCCPGTTYDHDFEMNQYDNMDDLAKQITEYAIQNSEHDERERGYGIWIIYNGDFIIGHPWDSNGKDPGKKLFDINNFDYDNNIEKEIEWEKILKALDENIGVLWRTEEEAKKEKARLKKKAESEKRKKEKIRKAIKQKEQEKNKLRELANKYPDELK